MLCGHLGAAHEPLAVGWLTAQIAEDRRRGLDSRETMAAFVTFESEPALNAALSMYPIHTATWLAARLWKWNYR